VPVAHACNPSYLGGWDWEDHGLSVSWGKKVSETPSQPIAGWSGMLLSSWAKQEAEILRIMVLDQPGQRSLQDLISREESWVLWHLPVIPVTTGCIKQEDLRPGWLGQVARPHLQNKQSKKGWECGISGYSIFLMSSKPWVQTPVSLTKQTI
jgi:hypothetical protein